jgi:hypothetical protein
MAAEKASDFPRRSGGLVLAFRRRSNAWRVIVSYGHVAARFHVMKTELAFFVPLFT